MPIGRYLLVMDFVIEAEAGGLFDGHATTELSPGATIPDSWVRTRDPFQGIEKTGFGFSATLGAMPATEVAPAHGPGPFQRGGPMTLKRRDMQARVARMSAGSDKLVRLDAKKPTPADGVPLSKVGSDATKRETPRAREN